MATRGWRLRLARMVAYCGSAPILSRQLTILRTGDIRAPSVVSKHLCSQFWGRTEHGTRRTLSVIIYFSVAFSVFRSPFSDLLVTALRAPAGYYPAVGYRQFNDGTMVVVSTNGYVWSSFRPGLYAYYLAFGATAVATTGDGSWTDARARSVRCLQAFTSHFLLSIIFSIFVP